MTNKTLKPVVILVRPQLGRNIGAAARAMLNFDVSELRLVNPRDGWPNPEAEPMAAGAVEVLENVKVFDSVQAATEDLTMVVATTARRRDAVQRVVTPRQAGLEAQEKIALGQGVGFLFGPENSGMSNEDLACADTILNIPTNPDFSSLNLAQAVLLVCYEYFAAGDQTAASEVTYNDTQPASKKELNGFANFMVQKLDQAHYFWPENKRDGMEQNLRFMLQRLTLTSQEVQTLYGAVKSLSGHYLDKILADRGKNVKGD